MKKTYSLSKILSDYNKRYDCSCKIPPNISGAILMQTGGTFYVSYNLTHSYPPDDSYHIDPLVEFFCSRMVESISATRIQNIINLNEEKKLNVKIEIWPSSKIRYAYLCTNYLKNTGTLGNSCMRNHNMQKSLNFYIKNKTRIVVVVNKSNKILARALLWDNVKTTESTKVFTYLDRMYVSSEDYLPLFDKLVKENRWRHYPGTKAGKAKTNLYKDNLDITGICYFPWADTFNVLYYKDNILTSGGQLSQIKHKDIYLNLTHIGDGGYFPNLDPNRVEEAFTNNFISKKQAIFIKRYKKYVLKDHIVNIDNVYYSKFDAKNVIDTNSDGYILRKDAVQEVFTLREISKTTAIYSTKYNGYVHKSNAVNIKDEIYHKGDDNIIDFGGDWYHISDCFVNYNRDDLNKELAKLPILFQSHNAALYTYVPYKVVEKDGNQIPKKHAIIAYNIIYNGLLDNIEYQEVYRTSKTGLIKLITGEFILNSSATRRFLKKFNNKYYIRKTFRLGDTIIVIKKSPAQFQNPDKKQLLLFG